MPVTFLVVPGHGRATGDLFGESWDSGTGDWTVEGTSATTDCSVSYSGCALKLQPTAAAATASKYVSIPVASDGVNVSTYFRPSSLSGTADTTLHVQTDGGDVAIHPSSPGDKGNNGLTIFVGTDASEFYAFPTANVWYRIDVWFNGTELEASVYDANGARLATSRTFEMHAGTTEITRMSFAALKWTNALIWHYDSLRVYPPPWDAPLGPEDRDSDHVPDYVEMQLCDRPIASDLLLQLQGRAGSCANSTNYVPPLRPATLRAPTWVENGTDADGDGFPAFVTVSYTTYAIDASAAGATLDVVGERTVEHLDPADADPNLPIVSAVCSTLKLPTSVSAPNDADGDWFPAEVHATRGEVCADKRNPGFFEVRAAKAVFTHQADPNDADASLPAQRYVTTPEIPVNATFSADGDRDGIPRTGYIAWWSYTIDGQDPRASGWNPPRIGATTLDPDDADRNDPVPYSLVDADGDHVPDLAEPFLCGVEDATTAIDGLCRNNGQNFVPTTWFQAMLHAVRL